MKKLMVAFCSAVLACVGVAQDAPKADAEKPVAATEGSVVKTEGDKPDVKPEGRIQRQRMRREGIRRQRPMMFVITEKTTSEQIEAFKKEVCSKIDETAKSFAAQEGEMKAPKSIMLFVNDRVFNQREGGLRRGPRDGDAAKRRGPREDASRPTVPAEAKK